MSLEVSIHPGNIPKIYAINVQSLEQENHTTLSKYIKKIFSEMYFDKVYGFLAIGFAHF